MIFFLKLFLAHIIGDFLLQPDNWIKSREVNRYKSPHLYLHIFIHAIILAVLLEFQTIYWIGFTFIIFTHLLIDLFKTSVQKNSNKSLFFFIDQALHISVLLFVTQIYTSVSIDIENILTQKNLLLFTAIVLLTSVSAVFIKVLISAWAPGDKADDSLDNAGKYIGMLERLFVFGFIATLHWEAVGFLLAAKSIFRFGDLKEAKDRKLTEYMLIGTLLSFGFAILISLIYIKLINPL